MIAEKILLVVVSLGITSCAADEAPTQEVAEHQSEIIAPRMRTVRDDIESFGSLVIRSKADITTAVDGRVQAVPVNEGDLVDSGQVVAVLENIQLQVRLRQAESDVASAESRVVLQEARLAEARDGIHRRLVALQQREIEQRLNQFEQEFLEESIAHAQRLAEVGGTSDEELRALYAERVRLQSEHDTLSKQIELESLGLTDDTILETGESVPEQEEQRIEALAQINTRTEQAELDLARSAHESARAELESVELLLEELTLRAPRTGFILTRHIESGERVQTGDPVISLFENNFIHALLPVPESQTHRLTPGLPAEITVPSRDDEQHTGEVQRVSPTVDPQSGNIAARILLQNPQESLRPGMFVRGRIGVGRPREALSVPLNAVVERRDSEGTVIVVRDRRALRRPVELGIEQTDGWIEVTSGLSGDELLVNSPSSLIREGDRIVD